jgi:hypothetical protein
MGQGFGVRRIGSNRIAEARTHLFGRLLAILSGRILRLVDPDRRGCVNNTICIITD